MRNFRGVRVELQDISITKLCRRGGRKFFARHGLDWSDFVKNGIPIKDVLETGDGLSQRVAMHCLKRHGFSVEDIETIMGKYYS